MDSCGQNKLSRLERGEMAKRKKGQRGQLVIEYVLLMLLAVAMASILQSRLLGGSPDDPQNAGLMSRAFFNLATAIARDSPGE